MAEREPARVLAFPQAPEAIELRHLRAFVAVAEGLSFSRAADRLHISQSALSRQVRALEQFLGCELLRRSTHDVELTIAGEALLDRARRLLAGVDEAVTATQALGGELASRLAQLWAPLLEIASGDADLEECRAAYEEFHGQFSPPPGIATTPVNAGGVTAFELAAKRGEAATVLYLHGGGYIMGSAFGYRPLIGALAMASRSTVLAPDYRLAPEHPFPAGLDDATRAYRWMLERGTPPERVVLAGDSAGAGLAMSLLIHLKREGLELPGGALLFCPFVDLSGSTLRVQDAEAAAFMLDQAMTYVASYLGDHPLDDPVVSPLSADLSGLPPLLIQAATGDPQREDAHQLTQRARSHGVDAHLELYSVETHAFQTFWSFLPEAMEAIERGGEFTRAVVAGDAEGRERAARGSRRPS